MDADPALESGFESPLNAPPPVDAPVCVRCKVPLVKIGKYWYHSLHVERLRGPQGRAECDVYAWDPLAIESWERTKKDEGI